MTKRVWIIVGATSAIAEQFAHRAAKNQCSLRLVGRDSEQLNIIAQDIRLRYKVPCEILKLNMTQSSDELLLAFASIDNEADLFLAHSDFTENEQLNNHAIHQLITTNVLASTLLINAYLKRPQQQHHLLYLSSVAACRGRSKNSLYGGTKAAVELYLQGMQQSTSKNSHITIARLGFIDTKQTYGLPGIFYAAPPKDCAQACWDAVHKNRRMFYYPGFWRIIMAIISRVPFFIYKKMKI